MQLHAQERARADDYAGVNGVREIDRFADLTSAEVIEKAVFFFYFSFFFFPSCFDNPRGRMNAMTFTPLCERTNNAWEPRHGGPCANLGSRPPLPGTETLNMASSIVKIRNFSGALDEVSTKRQIAYVPARRHAGACEMKEPGTKFFLAWAFPLC